MLRIKLSKKQYHSDVRSSLLKLLQDDKIRSSIGVAKFTTEDKNVYSKVYLRQGKVYAVYSTEYTPDYITRFYQSGDLSASNLDFVSKRFNTRWNHPSVSEFLIDRHMVAAAAMDNVTKDFFISIFDDVLRWENITVDWITNETTDFLKVPAQDLDNVLNLIDRRKEYVDSISEALNVPEEDLFNLTFVLHQIKPLDSETPLIFHQMISCSTGRTAITEAAEQFGLTGFRSLQTVYDLWQDNFITLIYNNVPLAEKETFDTEYQHEESAGDIATVPLVEDEERILPNQDGSFSVPENLFQVSSILIDEDEDESSTQDFVFFEKQTIEEDSRIHSEIDSLSSSHSEKNDHNENEDSSNNDAIFISSEENEVSLLEEDKVLSIQDPLVLNVIEREIFYNEQRIDNLVCLIKNERKTVDVYQNIINSREALIESLHKVNEELSKQLKKLSS